MEKTPFKPGENADKHYQRMVPQKNEMNIIFVTSVYFIDENKLANSFQLFNQEQTEIEKKIFFISICYDN